ncbi:MAG: hypothetical protein WC865_09675 [Bacteroidales bacterium]
MMKKAKTDYRQRLFIFLMVLLSVPLIQSVTLIVKEQPLKGAVSTPENVQFTLKDWFSASYQTKKEKYYNDAFGFRSLFVRINNQMALSLFREVHAFSVIFGKENYLFEENYIKSWYGADFIGEDSIAQRIAKLKFIQYQMLARYNKNLLVIFAAGKGSFYPEFFPPEISYPKGPTNYETHVRMAHEAGLKIIDFNRWFLENKTESPFLLYPKYGIHWSIYGTSLVADSLLTYIEKIRGIDLPSLSWDRVELKKAQKDDYDMGYGLNLLFRLRRDKMAYPVLKFESGEGKIKPSVLMIADSFYWGMFKFGITRAFSTSDFWFYNKEIYHTVLGPPIGTDQVGLWEQIQSHDVIILMATEANLPKFGWGFIDEAYQLLLDNR